MAYSSVRKRTYADGTIRHVLDYFDSAGKRRLETYKTKAEAKAAETKVRHEVSSGIHTARSASLTVAQAGKRWIEHCEGRNLQRTSLKGYQAHLDQHIKPYLGRIKLADVTTATISNFADALRLGKPAPGDKEGKVRSPDLVRRVRVSLGSLLAYAHQHGLVAQNVSRGLRKGGGRRRRKLMPGRDFPSPEEIKTLVNSMQGRYRPLLITAIFTGLRASELRGLRWQDVDLKKAELHVTQRADAFNAIDKPKSEAGERRVPLTPDGIVVNTLSEWKLRCPESKLNLVFPTRKGQPDNHANIVVRGLAPAMIAAGLVDAEGKAKYTGLHCLRHFYASWCINRRVDGGQELPPKMVQDQLGHATLAMTMDTYGHLFRTNTDSGELAAAERTLLGSDSEIKVVPLRKPQSKVVAAAQHRRRA